MNLREQFKEIVSFLELSGSRVTVERRKRDGNVIFVAEEFSFFDYGDFNSLLSRIPEGFKFSYFAHGKNFYFHLEEVF